MNRTHPIYTKQTECQDCYRCVRQCPVKAIRVREGHAEILPEQCTACGHCVEICPAKAKTIRNDLPRAKELIRATENVYVSLAPSWVNEFCGIEEHQMIASLKALGFTGVGETALGAQQVSAVTAAQLKTAAAGLYVSSACPATVEFFKKYLPEFNNTVMELVSPVIAHADIIRRHFGQSATVVMIGPCVAKKLEADRMPNRLNLVLTFQELHRWFDEAGITPETITPTEDDHFVPAHSEEGAMYPVEGGMIDTIRAYEGLERIRALTLTGLKTFKAAFSKLNPNDIKEPVFVETLACKGGCINGPCSANKDVGLIGRLNVLKATEFPEEPLNRIAELNLDTETETATDTIPDFTEDQLKQALQKVGKYSKDDELNCEGCGYESCREFGRAMLLGNAEPAMCVSHMRMQAQKKANALLRCMPSGVVITDENLKIIECNERFAEMMGEDAPMLYTIKPGLQGANLEKIAPFAELFRQALKSGNDLHKDFFKYKNKLFNITIFSIDLHRAVGAVVVDVTRLETRREQIAKRAREVIDRNLSTVQEIAFKLGEHMAETEILLNSIAEDYADDKEEEDQK